MITGKLKVLYIAGSGRNGSTLLGNILAEVEGFTNVGELIDLGWNLAPGRPPCGCGVPLPDCGRWALVIKEAFGGADASFVARMHRLGAVESLRDNITQLATPWGARKLHRRLARTLEDLERLFRAIQKVFKCTVVVDSSKQPMYLHMLQSIEAIDLRVVHLVRDPRAWAYAFLHRVAREGYVLHMKPLQSCVKWSSGNFAVEMLTRRLRPRPLRIRYEDFVADPRETILKIVRFTGSEDCTALPFEHEHTVNLPPHHTVAGNPNRFMTGRIEIRNDEQWATHMKRSHKALVTAVTLPWLIRYGYLNPKLSAG
ncbi:MAG: sulfotransferase [Terriglobia bacterium]